MKAPALAAVLRRIPRAAWLCALVACLNAACWSLLTPAFQTPDEPAHFAYVKQIAETGRLPSSNSELLSSEEMTVLQGLHNADVRQRPQVHTIASRSEQRELQQDLALYAGVARTGSPSAGVAASEPPLYYALEAIPYRLAGAGTLLDRLTLMRLMSALYAGFTAMFAFLFVREALPGVRWAWAVGGLGVALAPLLGFMSGAVNPDALLFAVCAASFYLLARGFRRGLCARLAVALGATLAIGTLTKLSFLGLVPGILLGLIVLSVRVAHVSRRSALRLLALAVAVAFSPAIVYAVINALSNHRLLGIASSALQSTHTSELPVELDYIWQLYMPRLPGTANYFPGLFTTRQIWFDGYVGLYGWLDTPFAGWVDSLALIPAAITVLLCCRSLVRGRAALRRRLVEVAVYLTMAAGLAVLVGASSFRSFPGTDAEYGQVRYLLPLLPLLAALLVLAVRGLGDRWGRVLGALFVILFLAHDVLSQLQLVSRFYG